MDIINLLISLASGAVGGNAAGAALPDKSLGALGNTIAGIVGGGAGSYIMQALGFLAQAGVQAGGAGPEFDVTSILTNVASSGVGGAILTVIVGFLKNAMKRT